jgi:hypothetical protein
LTGVTTVDDYLNNPDAQEQYQEHLAEGYEKNAKVLRKKHNVSSSVPDETLMMLQHFLGLGDADLYLETLMKTKSYDAAQEAVNESIRTRTKKDPPKNTPVVKYIELFQNRLFNTFGNN